MSLTDEERGILVAREIEKAMQLMAEAEAIAGLAFWGTVANRLYYALFHAVSSLLVKDGHRVGTHKGAVAAFGQYYVKTGIMTADDGRLYAQLQSLREKADYNCIFQASEEEIYPQIQSTRKLIDKIQSLVK